MIDVAVIGGGVSGLATALELKRRGLAVTVLERQTRAGGNAVSERFGGFLMEHGPSTVNAGARAAGDLSRALGLEDRRCDLGAGVRRRYLVKDGSLRAISVHPLGFLFSDYLSWKARARLAAELAVGRGAGADETVARFCTRRFGAEFTASVIDPLVGGLYAGRASELSMAAVFPRLIEMEERHGSIALAVLRRRLAGGTMPGRRLFSWRGGIGTLPRTLAAALGDTVRTGIAVRKVVRHAGGFVVDAAAAGKLHARGVVLATQPHVATQLLAPLDGEAAEAAGGISAPPLAVAFLGYRRDQVAHPLDGLGFLAAEGEGRHLAGAQFCSTMFPGRAPAGHVSLAAYVGGARAPERAGLAAEDIAELAHEEFRDLLHVKGRPVVARVRQWPLGLPQYRLGHGRRVETLRGLHDRVPGLFVTGNYLSGPSIGACLDEAQATATLVSRAFSVDLAACNAAEADKLGRPARAF